MDLTMVCGGLFISLLRGLDHVGTERAVEALDRLAHRDSCTPGERDIFQKILDSVCDAPVATTPARPSLHVIEGGAA